MSGWKIAITVVLALAVILTIALYACCIAAARSDRREDEESWRWDE